MESLTGQAFNAARAMGADSLWRSVSPYVPSVVRGWVTSASTRSRYAGDLVPAEQLEATYREALALLQGKSGSKQLGDYVEFGVCHGTSMLSMHRALEARGIVSSRLFGFDSFEGLPPIAAVDDGGIWQPGSFKADLEYTCERLTAGGIDWNRTFLIKGWFSDTLTDALKRQHSLEHASVIMMDCDIYTSTVDALHFSAPLIKDHAVILFDDWHAGGLAEKQLGEKKACDEFLAAHPDLEIESLPTYAPSAEVFLISRRNA